MISIYEAGLDSRWILRAKELANAMISEFWDEREGGFFLTVYFKREKIFPTQRFESHNDAHHTARMVVDKDRVGRMNHEEK